MKLALVKIDTAVAELCRTIDHVYDLVDGGRQGEPGLLWVWNVATDINGQIRSLRFWHPELKARASGAGEAFQKMQLAEVIARIIPPGRRFFQAGELDQMFQIRRPTRIGLQRQLNGRRGSAGYEYPRATVAAFLETRWLGNLGGFTK